MTARQAGHESDGGCGLAAGGGAGDGAGGGGGAAGGGGRARVLALNRGFQSMTELEEALVLREIAQTGLTQVQMAELVQRHKSWVSRRIGLLERLHPELVEAMKVGMLAPGVAR